MKTKQLLLACLCCTLLVSCSGRKMKQLSEQFESLSTQIIEFKDSIHSQTSELYAISQNIKEINGEIKKYSRDTANLNHEIEKLTKKIEDKKMAAEKAKYQPVRKGRKANEAGPNDKRYTVDPETGRVIY